MITLSALELTNIATYDDLRLELDRKGLTVIYGRNLDSGLDAKKSNGAGKSLPFTVMAETLLDQHPLIDGRHTAKDAFYRKDARVAVEAGEFRLEKFVHGKTLKYDLFKDIKGEWVPTKVRTNEYVWSKMATIFPINLDEFFALYYVDSSRPSILQRGSHSSRLKLLSQMFNLEHYDQVLASIKARLKDLRVTDSALTNVQGQIDLLAADLEMATDMDIEELNGMRTQQAKLSTKRASANTLLNLISVWDAHQATNDSLTKLMHDIMPNGADTFFDLINDQPDNLQEFIDATADGKAVVKKALKVARTQADQLEERKVNTARLLACDATIGKWTKKTATAERDAHASYTKDYNNLVSAIDRIKASQAYKYVVDKKAMKGAHERTLENCPGVDLKDILDYWANEEARSRAQVRQYKTELDEFEALFSSDEDCVCPTCKSELGAAAIGRMLKRYKSDLEKEERAYTTNKELRKDAIAFFDLMEKVRNHATATAEVGQLMLELSELKQTRPDSDEDEVIAALTALKTREEVKEALAKSYAALDVSATDSAEDLQARLDKYTHIETLLKGLTPYVRQLKQADEAHAQDYDQDEIAAGLKKLDKQLSALMADIPALQSRVSLVQAARAKIAELDKKKEKLAEELQDLPVLKALEDAYGQRGLKNIAIRRVCDVIESNLNLYSHMMFSEKSTFTIEVDETHLHILVTREFAGEQVPIDVRRLSGAESRAFNMLLPMAILPLIPANRRLNILVLDEPTANLDEPAIELFTSKFLPKLLELVPHVIILSPNEIPIDAGQADVWTVVREHGTSTLTPGLFRA